MATILRASATENNSSGDPSARREPKRDRGIKRNPCSCVELNPVRQAMTAEGGHVKQCTVLLVEDNLADAKLALHGLEKSRTTSFVVEHVDQLSEALSRLARGGIDVALVDLSLPDSSGMETFQAIHAAAPTVPIVVLTGLDDERVVLEMLHQGAQDYLFKHEVEPKLMARSLRFAIERQRTAALESCILRLAATQAVLKTKNRRLAKLCRTAHEFVDNVSHEFRTPLTVIKEYVSLVKDGVVGAVSDEQQQMLTIVETRADDLNTMVDDMLDVSKLEAGLLGVHRNNCQVSEIVAHVWPAIERKAAVKDVQLEINVDPQLPPVYCDAEKAGRVLINLTANAIKFCGQPGRVWVNCDLEPDGTGVIFTVNDNGDGINPKDQQAIFRRFKQLGESARSSTKGFGLGLNIAKKLVELNLGVISVDSKIGCGSTFSFTLPRADSPEVLRRYLKRVKILRNGSAQVSLVQAEIDEATSTTLADDVNSFLSGQLRSDDLLFRDRPARWLVVLPVAESEIAAFRERIAGEVGATNRNRLGKPLPDIGWEVLGAWHVTGNQDDILSGLSNALVSAEGVHA
jgi:signal transduction histidine kinase